jgi:anti-sigma factor RsiW
VEAVPETCLPYDQDLSALLDGELPAERVAALRAHSAACPRCAAELEALGRANERLRSALRAPVPEEDARIARVEAQLRARLAQEAPVGGRPIPQRAARAPRRRSTRWIVSVGLGLAAAAALGIGLLFQARTPVKPAPATLPPVAELPAPPPPPPSPAPQEAPPPATQAPQAVAELPVVKPAPARPRAPAPPAPSEPTARPRPSAPPEVDLASADEEDIELATRLDMLKDFEVIQKLDLLERLRKAEEGAGSG